MMRIEDYGFIGDMETGALVGVNGSMDWLCMPRFDSAAIFAALLGDENHGRWKIAPQDANEASYSSRQRYWPDTLILETEFTTPAGRARVIDFMPPRGDLPDVVRIVEGLEGEVAFRSALSIRPGYGKIMPWVRKSNGGITAIAGPDALHLSSDVETHGEDFNTIAEFSVKPGQRVGFTLQWHPSHEKPRHHPTPENNLKETEDFWHKWCAHSTYEGPWREQVMRSLITLKALTYKPTGGVVAALTTSLPEQIGGVRNWDYRYCWIRDATFTLMGFMGAGYTREAASWRDWLLRAVAGNAAQMQIMYGVAGERSLVEMELPWLPGYEKSQPVRTGNAASTQFQLDVYGELMDAMHQARLVEINPDPYSWRMQHALLEYLESAWQQPDEGIWEVRGPRQHFTHSKVMAWVAFDRAVKSIEAFKLEGPLDRWKAQRDALHAEICAKGYNSKMGAFTQYYGSDQLDASLLMLPLVGFLPATDARVIGTVQAIEKHLCVDGFVLRYHTDACADGLPEGEGTFLPCSFWLVDNYVLMKRYDDARCLFEKLLTIGSPLGLFAEEYDPRGKRLLGNYPQAFTHVGLVNSALNLAGVHPPCEERGKC